MGESMEILDGMKILDGEKLKLHNRWSHGGYETAKKNKWFPVKYRSFDNIADLWRVVNGYFCGYKFKMNIMAKESWLFRNDLVPHWDNIKKDTGSSELVELRFIKPSEEAVLDIILLMVGEDIPHSEEIAGIRIKPSPHGGDIRLWILKKSVVSEIRIRILKEVGRLEYNETNL
jgi:hypothetical protein